MVGYTVNWHPQVNNLLQSKSGENLKAFLQQEKQARKIIFPHSNNWFKAFELTPFNDVKVVILGQDPYHNDGQAHGLSFSVPDGVTIPPSLRNIYIELQSDLGVVPNTSGNLEHWAKQGVLLLNSVLTVEKNSPGSHAQSGWVDFTDGVIDIINAEKQNVVFLLWGAYAYKKAVLIDNNKHLVLTATHPSPFSAHKGFFGCKHFSKANKHLKMHELKQINW
ncbi:uracil-DNA glycosylase [thiotrophic endosymbiont of Bathymodiolus puteoserpentis (Logatchev)]|uniref:uracil-DNA glycosylase n=1 Tax=thiotrophic endosymbiont of Bathymodiolus puteoserpentis (Logatchev) TaxID=343240 RepID=UPI001118CFBB|nr:uracil-DNA glycosylase [thiotrophic endosymbiont of Bathymodiolus puteoserpentis (Logatchev)]